MADERIISTGYLPELHNGASPESVQERFDATFTGALLLRFPHGAQLMNPDSGVALKMSWSLRMSRPIFCTPLRASKWEDTEHSGHPAHVFMMRHLALRAALIRIRDRWIPMSSWKMRKCWQRCARLGPSKAVGGNLTSTINARKSFTPIMELWSRFTS